MTPRRKLPVIAAAEAAATDLLTSFLAGDDASGGQFDGPLINGTEYEPYHGFPEPKVSEAICSVLSLSSSSETTESLLS